MRIIVMILMVASYLAGVIVMTGSWETLLASSVIMFMTGLFGAKYAC